MKETIKKSLVGGIVFCLPILTLFIAYAATTYYTDLPQVSSGSVLSSSSWNNLVNYANKAVKQDTEVLTITGGKVGIGTTSPGAKLDINGNMNATPVIGKWSSGSDYQLANTDVNWATEYINTNPSYMVKNASGTGITILISGYYQINTKVVQYAMCDACYGAVELRKNGARVDTAAGYGGPSSGNQQYFYHSFSSIDYFNSGDVITVNVTNYPIHPGTYLEIQKLN